MARKIARAVLLILAMLALESSAGECAPDRTDDECATDNVELLQSKIQTSFAEASDVSTEDDVAHANDASTDADIFFHRRRRSRRRVVDRSSTTGKIDALYTFGSPSLGTHALENAQSPDKCFPGKRVYAFDWTGNQDWAATLLLEKPWATMQDVVEITVDMKKQIEAIVPASWGSESAKLIQYYGTETHKTCSSSVAKLPSKNPLLMASPFHEFGTEMHNYGYWFNYSEPLLIEKFVIANGYNHPCRLTRYGINQISKLQIEDPDNKHTGGQDYDSVHLFQHKDTLKCYMTFRPSDLEHPLDQVQQLFSRTYCDISGLGKYVVDELDDIVKNQKWKTRIQDKLPKCNGLELIGHSLGGAIASILATCLNKNSWATEVYESLLWEQGTPELLTPDSDSGITESCS